jgi:outer membrane protein TolC
VLVGENPSTFHLAPAAWNDVVPAVPGVVQGDILQRRPDIANAERLVAAANSAIGIQRSAFSRRSPCRDPSGPIPPR